MLDKSYQKVLNKLNGGAGSNAQDFLRLRGSRIAWDDGMSGRSIRGRKPNEKIEAATTNSNLELADPEMLKGRYRINANAVLLTYFGFSGDLEQRSRFLEHVEAHKH